MSSEDDGALRAYVAAAAQLTAMSLSTERVEAVAAVMTRIAGFAADIGAFVLDDAIEIAGPAPG